MALFSLAYWAPVSYYWLASIAQFVEIEQHEKYQKQSYRNRCTILSANGPLSLVVPVLRPHNGWIRDVRIDYSKPWQQAHWRSIETAYRSSPYYEEYHTDIIRIYRKEFPFLFDLNIKLWELSLNLLNLSLSWGVTERFTPLSNGADDYRSVIHPKAKQKLKEFVPKSYFQVFAQKYGFTPNLSILDLIFNEGCLKLESET